MRLLDLFCGAGGCAVGYYRAGFTEIVGVDLAPQPRFPFTFHRGDALEFLESVKPGDFDCIHASPPCQSYSRLRGLTTENHPQLIGVVRALLAATGIPYVIENVHGAPLPSAVQLCGSSFGLNVWRHRRFEVSAQLIFAPECRHWAVPRPLDVTGTGGPLKGERKAPGGGKSRKPSSVAEASAAMGIDWMTRREISQAIPPAYTEFIGRQLLSHTPPHTP